MRIVIGDYKRKDGRWESYVIYEDPDTGEDKKKCFYSKGDRGAEARRKRNAFVDKLEAGDYSDIRKVTVAGWLEKYLEVYCADRAQTTIDGYRIYIDKHIVPAIGEIKLAQLKPLHLQKFYNAEKEKGYSGKTILQEHHILHRAFKKAIANKLLAINPCDGVDRPQVEEYTPTIYTEEQFTSLIDKLKGHRMEAIILLAGMCGLRRGELLGLKWEHIDFDAEVVHVTDNLVATSKGSCTKAPKSKTSTRDIAIPSAIMPTLKRLRGIGKIYAKLNGEDYNPGSFSKRFSEFLKANNLPHIRLHDLRHFNATMMLRHGVTDREALARLGHSDLTMTRRYQHIVQDMDRSSAEKLNIVLTAKTAGTKQS